MSFTMKADFINPFLLSTIEVFKEVLGVEEIQLGKPSLKYSATAEGLVTGIIDMKGRPLHGSYAISLSKEFAAFACTQQFGRELRAETDVRFLARDIAGELCNMVCGRAKSLLSENNMLFCLSVPRTFFGPKHDVQHVLSRPVLQIPIATKQGNVNIESNFGEVKTGEKYWLEPITSKKNTETKAIA